VGYALANLILQSYKSIKEFALQAGVPIRRVYVLIENKGRVAPEEAEKIRIALRLSYEEAWRLFFDS
jgi:hypothetical protein